LQDENDKLREVLSWLSSQEPQLGMMITSCKRFDGRALGFDKVGECSGEREDKFGNVQVPPQSTPKDKFVPKPNQSRKPREKPSEKPSEKPCEEPYFEPKPRPIRFHSKYSGKDGHKREFCYKRRREARMANEWANKDRYHPSHGVADPRMPLPKGKGVVHTVPAWRDRRVSSGGKPIGRGPLAKSIRVTGQTGARQSAGEFSFHGCDTRGFNPFSRGTDGKHLGFGGVEFVGRSPSRDQYEFGRDRSFESQRGYVPWCFFCGTHTPPVKQEWFSHGGSRFDRFDRMDRSIDRHGRINVANPTFEEMARHWFDTFGTNPSVESFARSRSWF
jgi:hypothetical protein